MEVEMIRKSGLAILTILFFVGTQFSLAGQQYQGHKKRIAVFTFEDKTDHRWRWWTGQPVGEGMADMLITALVKSGHYQVFERKEINQIIEEQKLGQTGLVTPQTAAKVGNLLGVELAVIGAVTEFGYQQSKVGGRIKGFGLGVKSNSATVGIDVRLINTNSGEIIAADNIRKTETKKGLAFSSPKFAFKNQNDFDESLVGKAVREAIEDIVKLIDTKIATLPWEAKIILVKGDRTIYINAGSQSGLKIGDVLTVYRKGEELIDPDTGLSLGSETEKIGTIKVIEDIPGGKASKAEVIYGSGFKKGDIVRLE